MFYVIYTISKVYHLRGDSLHVLTEQHKRDNETKVKLKTERETQLLFYSGRLCKVYNVCLDKAINLKGIRKNIELPRDTHKTAVKF